MFRILTVAGILFFLTAWAVTHTLWATNYRVTVTRVDSNLYHVDYSHPDTYFRTRYCYEYAYLEDAIFNDQDMWLYFISSDTQCDVVRVLR